MRHQVPIQGFRGVITSVDEALVKKGYATDSHNVRSEDGSLTVRNGIRSIAQSFTGTPKGLHLAYGYDDSYAYAEEYVGFRESGGSVKPFSIDVDTGAGTEITNSGAALSLTNAEWIGCNFQGFAFYLTPGGTVYKHEVGDNTSWSALDPGQPNQFTTNNYPFYEFTGEDSGNTVAAGTTFSWAGFTGGGFATNTPASGVSPTTYVSTSGTDVVITSNKGGLASYTRMDFTLDMNAATAGIQDWSSVTGIQFTLSREDGEYWQDGDNGADDWPWAINSANARVWLYDNAGTPNSVELTGGVQTKVANNGAVSYRFILTIPPTDRGAEWSDTRKIRIFLPIIGEPGVSTADHEFRVSQITVDEEGGTADVPETAELRFGAVAYNADQHTEAINPTFGEETLIAITGKSRYYGSSQAESFLGNAVTVNIPASQITTLQSAAGVTHIRYYVAFMDEGTPSKYTMRLMDELEVGDAEAGMYQVPYTYEELRALPLREEYIGQYESLGTPVCMTAFRQWMVYGYAGGTGNVKHSRVGQPYALYSINDDAGGGDLAEDQNRGANFTLADNFADQPVTMVGADYSLYVFGAKGVYVQSGRKPSGLTPFRKVPGVPGVLGLRSACKWRADNGVDGVAYVAKDGESVWFTVAAASFDNPEPTYSAIELTSTVRGKLKSFLFAGSTPTVDKVYIFHDDRDDALWVCYQNRAMVLRRKNTFQGERAWEFYTYNITSGTLTDWEAQVDQGLRCLKSDGSLYEAERNKSTGFALIGGTGRDDGGNVPAGRYWQSGEYIGPRRRCFGVTVIRHTTTETVPVTVYTDREPSGQTKTVAANDDYVRFGQFAQGLKHSYRVTVTEGQVGIQALILEETRLDRNYIK